MTIKYAPVFGDQSLFDTAPEDCVCAIRHRNTDKTYITEVTRHVELLVIDSDYINIAMRRVIKTPTWTRANKEAWVLPPVGAQFQTRVGPRKCVITEGGFIFTVHEGHVEVFNLESAFPIETPEETAARLEDEFVTSLCKELDGTSLQHDSIYERGVRAAYRKLKAPTND